MDLLERDTAVAVLEDALAEARAGDGRIVLVAGEAGIGKTALVESLARAAGDRARFIWGACDPLLTPRALGPIHDAARQAGGELARVLSEGAPREAVFAALLDELDTPPPAVLVVEDLHWADEASLDALVVVGRRIASTTGTLVLTYRSDEIDRRPEARAVLSALPAAAVRRLELDPLSPRAVEELAQRAGRSAAGLHGATGGNPFFVTEALASSSPGVPATVREVVHARLSRLSEGAREIVQLSSVVPTRTELWLLREALGPDPAALDECVAGGLLTDAGDSVAFRHELAREAVAGELAAPRRRELDLRVLAALRTRGGVDAARVAHHARQAGDAHAILRHAPAAARSASGLGAHREALEHAEAALRAATELGEDRAELLELVSVEAYLCGRVDRALRARSEALAIHESAGRAAEVGESLRWMARLRWWSGEGEAAERAARRAIEVLEPLGPSPRLAMAYSTLSQLRMNAWRHDEAIDLGSRAAALARRLGDDETLVHALTNVGSAHLVRGERERGVPIVEEAFARASAAGFHDHAARALFNLTHLAAVAGSGEAGPQIERALVYAREHELGGYVQWPLGMRATLRLLRGDWTGAEEDARASLELGNDRGVSVVPALVALGTLQARRGDAAARETLDEAWARARTSNEVQSLAPAAAARLELGLLSGDAAAALADTREVYERAVGRADQWTLGELAFRLWLGGERADPADGVAEPYRRAMSGDWAEAAMAWDEIGRPYHAAEARSLADEDGALLQALAEFDRLGAAPAAGRLRRRLRERGVRAVPRGPRPATRALPHGLTPRQHEVLRLLVAGATNAEIAERLVVSPKTVDHHVSAVLAKLDVASRREAADVARGLGIGAGESGERAAPR